MCSSTWVYPQKLTEFCPIYKANYILVTECGKGWHLCHGCALRCPHQNHLVFYQVIILKKNCHFHMLNKDSLECCRETPEDHLCNEPCWKSAGSQEIASLRCRMHPGSRTGTYLCRQRSSCPCPKGKEREVTDSLQEEQELSLVEGMWDKEP